MSKLHNATYLIAIVLLTSTVAMAARGYRTDLLERMAAAMNMHPKLQLLADGEYYRYAEYKGRAVTVIVAGGEVTHIGYSLFTPTQRRAFRSPACDFVERYALELSLPLKREKSITRQLDEDGVFFRNGNLETFRQLQQDTTWQVGIEMLDGKRYTVSWQHWGKQPFAINFPVEYDLLAGTDMQEEERRIVGSILRSSTKTRRLPPFDAQQLKPAWQGKYYVLPGEHYYTEQLNANCYITRDGGGYRPFFHPDFVVESLANLLTTAAVDNDYDLEIRLVKYGFVQDTIRVKLNQWVNYCIECGCKPFFGVISTKDGMADCEVIMQNTAMGYIHVMRLTVDIGSLQERRGLVQARLNSFVPTTRVKYLFDELKK